MAWEGLAAGAAEGVLLPQAAAVSARAPAMTAPTRVAGLPAGLVRLVRMASPVLVSTGAGGSSPGPVGHRGRRDARLDGSLRQVFGARAGAHWLAPRSSQPDSRRGGQPRTARSGDD